MGQTKPVANGVCLLELSIQVRIKVITNKNTITTETVNTFNHNYHLVEFWILGNYWHYTIGSLREDYSKITI